MKLIASGHWLYADSVVCGVKLSVRPFYYGSGDWEDEPEWRDDREEPTYVLEYQVVAAKEKWAGGGQYPTLESAKDAAREALGPSLVWHASA